MTETANEAAALIQSPAAVLAALTGIAAFFFWLERATGWKLFQYIVPLIWIYATPLVLRNVGVLPASSPVYDVLRSFGLPMFITLLLLSVDVGSAVRIMGKGILVMLLGTAGIVVGAPVGYFVVHRWLSPEAWSGFGALAGSWIGGTGNMAAAAAALETPPEQFGLAVLADTAIYVGWLPLLLISKSFAERFNRWTGVAADRLERMEEAARVEAKEERPATVVDFLYLAFIAAGVTFLAGWLAPQVPEETLAVVGLALLAGSFACFLVVVAHAFGRGAATGLLALLVPPYTVYYLVRRFEHPRKVLLQLGVLVGAVIGALLLRVPPEALSTSTWLVLLVSTFGILLSFTPARRIPASHNVAMGIVYVFVARMGATASLEGLAQAPAFLLGAAIWILIHGLFCLAGAWLFKVDVHSAAIASAANVGGAASAPVVAAHHRESLVPVSILMALLGYAMGNYLAILTGHLCRLVGT